MNSTHTLRTIVLAVAAALAGCAIGAIFLTSNSAPATGDPWERLRVADHCQQLRTETPSEDNLHGKTAWACDRGELIVRGVE